MTNLCALLVACAALQSPSAPPAAQAEPEWLDLDRIVLIVNEDIITYRQMVLQIKHERETRELNHPSEMQAAQNRIISQRVKGLLAKQAGQDMGADEQAVERRVEDTLERWIAGHNGVVGMSKLMQSKDLNTQDVKRDIREKLYAEIFMDSVTGEGPGLSERPNRDRYVRPGALKFRHERALRDPELLRQIGGSTELVTFQTLVLDSDKNGGRDETMALAHELEKSIESGAADMNDLVRSHSMHKANDGVGESVEIARLRQLDPTLAKFTDERPTDPKLWPQYVSEPFVVAASETRIVVRLARIREITPGVKPSLASNKTQEDIARYARESLDDHRLERAYAKLYSAAYIWPAEQAAPREH